MLNSSIISVLLLTRIYFRNKMFYSCNALKLTSKYICLMLLTMDIVSKQHYRLQD